MNKQYIIVESLDPKDWEAMKKLGHQMLDDMLNYLQNVRSRPVWQNPPEEIKNKFQEPLPVEPEKQENIYKEFLENILPFPLGNIHPRFWGWVSGTGTPFGMLAEMLAAGMNTSCHTGEHIANYVELQVLNWCKEILGYPNKASGLLVSGGSVANLIGIVVARNTKSQINVREKGLQTSNGKLVLYCSSETHFSVQKSVELLGLGSDSIRKIPVDDDFQINVYELEKAIENDKKLGLQPFCVIANIGTVGTGAIDDLEALADISKKANLWFHIDGAFGALVALLPEFRKRLSGIERADSLAFDFHKWMHIPYEAGCILIKDPNLHKEAFELETAYTVSHDRGIASGPYPFTNLGIEQSRGFKSLKIWFSLKEHGTTKYKQMIRKNIAQANYLVDLINEAPNLELLAPLSLNVVCFRFKPESIDSIELNNLNRKILMELHEQGIAAPSTTMINGKYAIRLAITNHRSIKKDFELLVMEVIRIGSEFIGIYDLPYIELCNLYRELGEHEQGLNILLHGLKHNSDNVKLIQALGKVYRDLERYEDAITQFEQAIKIDPNNAYSYSILGILFEVTKQLDSALNAHNEAIRLEPKNGMYQMSLGTLYRRIGDETKAQFHYQIARQQMNDEDLYNKACLEALTGNAAKALQYLAESVSEKPYRREWALKDPDFTSLHNEPGFKEIFE